MNIKKEDLLFYPKLQIQIDWLMEDDTLSLIQTDGINCDFWSNEMKAKTHTALKYIKPKVKPIINITEKEMQWLFNQFGNMMILSDVDHLSDIILIECAGNLDTLPLRVCKELAKMNYDIFGWLENDLAVELSCS